ncbi:hypothetical protein [Arthrobacter sp. 2MCAF14]|uniref:hypothetical protein n=1 Tax=Arthrobacter sp. 2MCAF14 TaxID=3232982 RepID=UPI003F9235B4
MTEPHRQPGSLWDSWTADKQQRYRERHAAVVQRASAQVGAKYGTPVEIVPSDIKGSTVVYKARVGRYAKAFTMDTMAPAAEQRALLDLQIGSLQATCELRTILDLHGTIDQGMKAGPRP